MSIFSEADFGFSFLPPLLRILVQNSHILLSPVPAGWSKTVQVFEAGCFRLPLPKMLEGRLEKCWGVGIENGRGVDRKSARGVAGKVAEGRCIKRTFFGGLWGGMYRSSWEGGLYVYLFISGPSTLASHDS